MVGFLVSEGMPLNELRTLSKDYTKSAFEQRLRKEIYKRAIGEDLPDPPDEKEVREQVSDRLDSLSHDHNSGKIKSLLLLFNLATLLQDSRSNMRFQFDSFKSGRWDIEHVRSVADDKPVRFHERINWLDNCLDCLDYLESQETEGKLCEQINDFLKLTQVEATNDVFDPLYDKLLEYFNEESEGEAEHGITNLTLLDEYTNRSYKNAVFAVKRQRLLNLDQAGIFVPLCTRNVFLKCYSPQVGNVMFWSKSDQDGYEEAITTALTNFFCGRME
jgi:hypothetical protein